MNRSIKLKTLWNRGVFSFAGLIWKYLYAKAIAKPSAFMIEPTDLCNLRCSICYTQKVKRKREKNFMSLNEFKRIIDEIKSYTVYINLWLAGESLLNKDLDKMIAYANKNNIITCLSTNAMLLDKSWTRKLLKAGLDRMIVSFDGARKKSYEKIRVGAKFETVLDNIKYLTSVKKKKPLISLQLVVTKDNEGEIEDFRRMARDLKVDEAYTKSLYTATQVDSKTSKMIASLTPKQDKYVRHVKNRMKNCTAKYRAVIQCDGTVIPCCFDILTTNEFGNAAKQRFGSIWNSKKYRDFRNSKRRFKESKLCRSCGCSDDYTVENLL